MASPLTHGGSYVRSLSCWDEQPIAKRVGRDELMIDSDRKHIHMERRVCGHTDDKGDSYYSDRLER